MKIQKKLEKKNEKELLIGTQILKTEEESLDKLEIKEENIELFDMKKEAEYDNLIKKLF